MTAMEGSTPGGQTPVHKKSGKQMVSRDDLMKAIQKLQLPAHQDSGQQAGTNTTQVWGANG